MHFGEMFFFAVRYFDEGNLGTTYIEEFLPLVRNIWILVTAKSFPAMLPLSDY